MFNKLLNRYTVNLTTEEARKIADFMDENPGLIGKVLNNQYENGLFAAGVVTIASVEFAHHVWPHIQKLLKK